MSTPSYSMPPMQVPFVDSNGRVNQAWYLFLAANFQSVGGPLVVPGGRAFDNADTLTALAIDPQAAFAETVKSNDDLSRQFSFMSDQSSCIAELAKSLDELRLKVEAISDQSAAVSEIKKYAQDLEISYSFVQPSADWEHPGKIGLYTANSGAFTTLTASASVTLSPANANVVLSPSGAGVVTISPATAGAMDNVAVGTTTPKNVRAITITTGSAPLAGVGSGEIGIQNSCAIRWRNAANNAYLNVIYVDGSNNLQLGGGGATASTIIAVGGVGTVGTFSTTGLAVVGSVSVTGGATAITTTTALTNGAGVGSGTITNAPAAGNPTKWIGINDNGTTRYIPAW